MIRYVKIKRPDTEEIREMLARFCEETNAEPGQLERIWSRLPNMHVFGALNGKLAGIGGYYLVGERAFADFVYVLPEYRNKSIAGRLHRMGTEHARESGAKRVVVYAKPIRANIYKKLKYVVRFEVLEKEL